MAVAIALLWWVQAASKGEIAVKFGDAGLSASAQRVQRALEMLGVELKVIELPQSTRTAQEAADAVGCEVGQIAKSLVFRGKESGRAILVITSGANRVNVAMVANQLGERIEKAEAAFVRHETGYAIGGVPPVGHATRITTFIDQELLGYEEVWAAAGTPRAVFRLTPQDLARITGGKVIRVA
jgi:prolyl-tRNA editing enzyme YbaK/EbsC (Cys-tRNA(Pro) deacylase)